MEQKPATIKEIAKRLNVSISTVSRALHNHSSIGLRTKTQVQQLAKEMNYEPNQAAISFKHGRTMTLGIILPNLREEYFSLAINGIEDMATANNYIVLIGQSHDELEREQKIADSMRRHRVDGLIVSLSKATKTFEHLDQVQKNNIPVVFFDRVPDIPDAHSVSCSLEASTIELIDLLVKKGHSQIALIKGPDTLMHSKQRLNSYYEGLKKHGLKVNNAFMVSTDLSKKKTQDAMHKLLALKKRPTAVIAFNDYVALDAIQYTRKQGLLIDKDISFVSYANLSVTSYTDYPPMASVEQFPYEQAGKATEILLQLIIEKGISKSIPHKIILESKVIINSSRK